MNGYFFIDDLDVAQELTKDAAVELAKKHGANIVNHIFIETFSEENGIEYASVGDELEKHQ